MSAKTRSLAEAANAGMEAEGADFLMLIDVGQVSQIGQVADWCQVAGGCRWLPITHTR